MAATNNEVWQTGTVVGISDLADGIKQFVIRQSQPAKAPAGSHIDLMIDVGGKPARRSYSVVAQSSDLTEVTIAVFKVSNSRGGSIAMHGLQVGQQLSITQPIQNFPFRFGAKRYVFLAGGIGITAIIEMANQAHRIGANYEFHYVTRSRAAMSFREQLLALHGDNLQLYFDDEGNSLDLGAVIGPIRPGTELYMCGPIRLMDEVRRLWANSDLDITNLRYETFGASGWFEPEDFVVRVVDKGAEVVVGKNQTIVEALEAAGLEVMSDCRKGECGLCEARILNLSGKIDHRDVFYSESQKAQGEKIACCVSRVISAGSAASLDVVLS